MITYKYLNNIKSPVKVLLDNKEVGGIKSVKGGWAYFPKGSKSHGSVFGSILEVKSSIEEL